MSIPERYRNAIGTWEVSTEGDDEGRTVKHLGIWTGNIAEIALHLASQCFYKLTFRATNPQTKGLIPTASKVTVALGADSETWSFGPNELVSTFLRMKNFPHHKVAIAPGNAYAAVQFCLPAEEAKKISKNNLLTSIKSKLTAEEWELLEKKI